MHKPAKANRCGGRHAKIQVKRGGQPYDKTTCHLLFQKRPELCERAIFNLPKGNAERIAQATKADVFEVDIVTPYSEDHKTCTKEAQDEKRLNARPAAKEQIPDISGNDTVFVVGPNWWGVYPMGL